MESGERKKNGDNKAGTARIGWGGIRKTDLEITGQEDEVSWEDGALGRIGTRLQGWRETTVEMMSSGQGPRGAERTLFSITEKTHGEVEGAGSE